MLQRLDLGTAARTSLKVLGSKRFQDRGFVDEKSLKLEGGKEPIKVQSQNLLAVEVYHNIPIEVRKQMIEDHRKKMEENGTE